MPNHSSHLFCCGHGFFEFFRWDRKRLRAFFPAVGGCGGIICKELSCATAYSSVNAISGAAIFCKEFRVGAFTIGTFLTMTDPAIPDDEEKRSSPKDLQDCPRFTMERTARKRMMSAIMRKASFSGFSLANWAMDFIKMKRYSCSLRILPWSVRRSAKIF